MHADCELHVACLGVLWFLGLHVLKECHTETHEMFMSSRGLMGIEAREMICFTVKSDLGGFQPHS